MELSRKRKLQPEDDLESIAKKPRNDMMMPSIKEHLKHCLLRHLYNDITSIILCYAQHIELSPGQPSRRLGDYDNLTSIWSMTADAKQREIYLVDNPNHRISVFSASHGKFLRECIVKFCLRRPRTVHLQQPDHVVIEGGEGRQLRFVVLTKDFSQTMKTISLPEEENDDCSTFVAGNTLTLLDLANATMVKRYNLTTGLAEQQAWKPVRQWDDMIRWSYSHDPVHNGTFWINPHVMEEESKICFVSSSYPFVTTTSSHDLADTQSQRIDYLPERHVIVHVVVHGSQFVMITRNMASRLDFTSCRYYLITCDRDSGDDLNVLPLETGYTARQVAVIDDAVFVQNIATNKITVYE